MKSSSSNCAKCPFKVSDRLCKNKDGKAPDFCPTKDMTALVEKSLTEYKDPDIAEFAKQASIQESEGYTNKELGYEHTRPAKSRIEEIGEFAKKMNYQRLGLAFCLGLAKEANIVADMLSSKGFDVVSAICKAGRIPKEVLGIPDDQKIAIGKFESMCNPVLQAMILNEEKTDFNIVLGLCVGHDSLFFKYGKAPCTVLAAKDRLLGHNPLAAIYCSDSYYRSLK
ncbi:MAG: DUF1847 domain-containing protein [Desulfobacterales bacterium]|nr:DUF1847 domain-containing protein [Desulfobacterales bacterium]